MKLLLDEMYPAALTSELQASGVEAATVSVLGLTGDADAAVFAAAVAGGYALLTENVGDFARIAAQCITSGDHHHGLLIALSSRFSRRPAGIAVLVTAIKAVARQRLTDRMVYLKRPESG